MAAGGPRVGRVTVLQFLGGGRMAEALIGGLLASPNAPCGLADMAVVEVDAARREALRDAFAGLTVSEAPGPCRDVVVATKPSDVVGALEAASEAGLSRVLSIAAGVRCAELQGVVGPDVPVVRAMPNTAALVGRGAAAVCAGSDATEGDLAWAETVLAAVGTVVRVPEKQMDAVTGLSGSGPAYVFLVAEALVEAGVQAGLPREVADSLTRQTLLGAATLLTRSATDGSEVGIEELRAAVTSPGGTTAAGLRVLEDRAVRAAFMAAVEAATERSAELG